MSTPKLFQPIQVGASNLSHRVVFAPATRYRANDKHAPLPHVAEYYSQRSKVPGTLVITEATLIALRAGSYANVPGIWSEEQIASWKRVTDAVHANGSYIYLQLWALGRAADYAQLQKEDPTLPYVSASDIPMDDEHQDPLHPLTVPEIHEYVKLYGTAASNAVHKAGFDGVEIHNANGYLLDQFLQDVSNKREDEYGGSVENRTRFSREVVDEVVKAVGSDRVGIRFSPWGTWQGMLMKDPKPTYLHLVSYIRDTHPGFSYIHVVEPRQDWHVHLIDHRKDWIEKDSLDIESTAGNNNDFIWEIWGERPLISTGGYDRVMALEVSEKTGNLIGFVRAFLGNPDLPFRLQHGIRLVKADRSKYYVHGSEDPKGYTDYPFSAEFVQSVESK